MLRIEGDAGIQQGIRVVWTSRHDDSKPADGLDRLIKVVGLEPLTVCVTDKYQELDRIDPVGSHKTSETAYYIELGVSCHCRTLLSILWPNSYFYRPYIHPRLRTATVSAASGPQPLSRQPVAPIRPLVAGAITDVRCSVTAPDGGAASGGALRLGPDAADP